MLTLKNEPQSAQAILEQSYNLFTQSLRISVPYSLMATLFIFVPQILIAICSSKEGLSNHLTIGILSIGWLGGITVLSALLFRLFCHSYQIPSHFIGSLQHALFRLISLLLLGILYCLIILSGTMLLIIPGIIFIISLMFSFILVITENQTVLQTLIMSHRLVWGHWWHVVYVITIPLLTNIALTLTVLLSSILILTTLGANITTIMIVTTLLNMVIQTFFIPLMFTIALVLLHDLRRRSVQIPRW
ncbi:MAG: hypothetical protein JSS07_01370 [Proteobacteria bacterium]|nr:hypothetical protein [Pseudomonadota bacterium]